MNYSFISLLLVLLGQASYLKYVCYKVNGYNNNHKIRLLLQTPKINHINQFLLKILLH
jgi:hypothetical protein